MKICAIEAIPISLPISKRLVISSARGTHSHSPFVIVRVHTDEGVVGLGEVSCTPIWSGEDQVTAKHFIDDLLTSQLVGTSPLEIERISKTMNQHLAGNAFTKAAIEMACWDIMGRIAGLPLYRLWGGPVREKIPIKFSISASAPQDSARLADWAVQQGFRAMKVKVGTNPDLDVQRFKAVREAIGPEIFLGADANGGWSVQDAIWAIKRMLPLGLAFIEQPVAAGNHNSLAQVRTMTGAAVLADESVETAEDAYQLARDRAVDAVSAYVGKGGGLSMVRRIASVAAAANLGCTLGSNLELGVATAAMIHLAASTSDLTCEQYPPDILGPLYYEADVLLKPLDLSGGYAQLPAGPGLGIELNDAMLERYSC